MLWVSFQISSPRRRQRRSEENANHGTNGRGLAGCVFAVVVAGARPVVVAVNLISPASFVDCTMICARPLNRLRDHGNALGWAMMSTVTLGFKPPFAPPLRQHTAMTLSPARRNLVMSKS